MEEEKLRSFYRNPTTGKTIYSESGLEIWLKNNPERTIKDYYNR